MTKVTDLEANMEQYKIDQTAINSEAAEQRALLQETIEKNKEDVLEGIFIKGLKQELRTAVRTQKPTGLSQAMELALIIESKFADKKAKELCYRCDGKFDPVHRCPEKALQVLLVDNEEEEEKKKGV
ncbi:hypothetical protein Tco_0461601 [Tanacetum coccineum]